MARSFFDNILDSATFGLFSAGKNAVNGGGLSGFASGLKDGIFNGFMNPNGFSSSLTDFVGLTNTGEQEEAYNKATQTYEDLIKGNQETFDQVNEKIAGNRETISELLGGDDAVNGYLEAIKGFDPQSFKTDLSSLANWEYGKDVDAFMDPAADYTINKSVQAAQNAMAGQGGLSGGAAAAQLQAVASEKASELYDKAFERMSEDKNFDYSKVKDLVDAEARNNQTALAAENSRISNLSKPFDSYLGNLTSSNENEINSLLAQFANEGTLKQALAQLGVDKASQGTWLSGLMSNQGLMSGVGSLIGAII